MHQIIERKEKYSFNVEECSDNIALNENSSHMKGSAKSYSFIITAIVVNDSVVRRIGKTTYGNTRRMRDYLSVTIPGVTTSVIRVWT